MLSTLVLTAGIGTRLDPLTRLLAKPAVPVAGQALVERVLAWLQREGVRDAVLNLHHRPDTITSVIGDGTHLGLRVRYSWEQPLLGSAGGPRHALPLINLISLGSDDTFLIVNGDTLCDFPLAPMIAAHRERGADATMALVPNPAPDHYNSVTIDDRDRVTGFVPKGARAAGGWHFVGVQIVRASIFAPLADGVPAETVAGLYRDGVASGTLHVQGYRADTTFLDVGTPRDYLAATMRLSTAAEGRVIESGAKVDASGRITRSIVWAGVTVGAGVVLEDCVAAGHVQIPPGFTARNAVIVPASVARADDAATIRGDVAEFQI